MTEGLNTRLSDRPSPLRSWHAVVAACDPALLGADLDGIYVQGVDMLHWNTDGKLIGFTVMVRPMRGLEKLIELMRRQLGGWAGGSRQDA